ncbi:hypothetical protein M5K25_015691 [Dendrobium thyrsiflorum]|uniref:Terpene synthase metal-binding domain-containing protein n=1 Tax=Dendrobium thyrsiflorum TaxID=117978 RepID=A0ABD0URH8_DENTH
MGSSSIEIPLFKRTDRIKTKTYISIYEQDTNSNEILLEFAKMDFICLQAIHQEEARKLSMWWKNIGLSKRLPFSRDRLIECYFLVLSIYFETCHSRARVMMTKCITHISMLDDIYDVYGTLEELHLLTNGIQSVTLITTGYSFLTCASYIGIEEVIPKDVFDWVTSFPEIIKATSTIGRLMNNVASYELEQKRNHVASVVQCYVMEHECSEEEACKKLLKMSNDAWKIINKEFVTQNKLPLSLIWPIINVALFNEFIYLGKDLYTNSDHIIKETISDVLIEPIQIHKLKD